MLTVYAVSWCPHCVAMVEFLKEINIEYRYVDMDSADPETEKAVIKVNGGTDWVVPTLECGGKWIKGKSFSRKQAEKDLKELGLL